VGLTDFKIYDMKNYFSPSAHTHTQTKNCKPKDANAEQRDTKYTKRDVYFVFYSSSPIEHRIEKFVAPNKFPKVCVEKLMCTTVSAMTEMRCEWGSYSDADADRNGTGREGCCCESS